MIEKTKPVRPLCLRKEAATVEIVNAINAIAEIYSIPFYILDDILFKIHSEVHLGTQKELERSAKSYNELLAEFEKNSAKNEKNEAEEVSANG